MRDALVGGVMVAHPPLMPLLPRRLQGFFKRMTIPKNPIILADDD